MPPFLNVGPAPAREPAPITRLGLTGWVEVLSQINGWLSEQHEPEGDPGGSSVDQCVPSGEETPLITLTLSWTETTWTPGLALQAATAARGMLGVPMYSQVHSGAGVVSALSHRTSGGRWEGPECLWLLTWTSGSRELGTLRASLLTFVFPGPSQAPVNICPIHE